MEGNTMNVIAPTSDEMTFLDFEQNRVQEITMQQLKMSRAPKDYAGNPLRGMFHYEFIDALQEKAAQMNLNISIWEMFAANNKEAYMPGVIKDDELEKLYGKNSVKAYMLNRVFTNLRISNFDDNDYTTCLAVSYHQKGIQVAVGSNVKVCHNQMIIGTRDFYAATYTDRGEGRGKINPTAKELVTVVGGFLEKIGDRVNAQRMRIEKMKQVELTEAQVYAFIGMLEWICVGINAKEARIRRQGVYPLNNSEINKFTHNIMLRKCDNGVITLWDIYDVATNLYKPRAMEFNNILPQNYTLAHILEEKFAV